jgi:hypothetical protein
MANAAHKRPQNCFDRDRVGLRCPFGRLWYGEPNAVSNTITYVKFRSRSHDALIRVYDEAGSVSETRDQAGDVRSLTENTAVPRELTYSR